MAVQPVATVVVPSLNQGRFLGDALDSIFSQDLPLEVIVMDGGSSDETLQVLEAFSPKLAYWQSGPDAGQAAAINEGVKHASAPLVGWLNSDDFLYPDAIRRLIAALERDSQAPFAYGKAWHVSEAGHKRIPYLTLPYRRSLFANYCGVCQPATLIRRRCWEAVEGLDQGLNLAFDFDLWLKLAERFGPPHFVNAYLAANRMHNATKTSSSLDQHYDESIEVVSRYYSSVPAKWRWGRRVMRPVRLLSRSLRARRKQR